MDQSVIELYKQTVSAEDLEVGVQALARDQTRVRADQVMEAGQPGSHDVTQVTEAS